MQVFENVKERNALDEAQRSRERIKDWPPANPLLAVIETERKSAILRRRGEVWRYYYIVHAGRGWTSPRIEQTNAMLGEECAEQCRCWSQESLRSGTGIK